MDVNFSTVIGTGGIPMYKKKRGQDYYTNRHSCFLAAVPSGAGDKIPETGPKGEVKELVYQIIRDIFKEKGLGILELNGRATISISCMRQIRSLPPGRLLMWSRPDQQVCKEEIWGYCFKGLITGSHCSGVTAILWQRVSENSLDNVRAYIKNQ